MLDFLKVYDLLTDTQRMVAESSRQFVTHEAAPLIRDAYREGYFPPVLPEKLGALGFLGPTVPVSGREIIDNISYGLMMRELERCDSALRSFASVQGALVMFPIAAFGSPEQKARWLKPLADGKIVGCFGLTEADGGSDPGRMKTRAILRNGEWELSGSKCWITNGSIAGIAIVWAQTENGIRGFVVETDRPGFSTAKMDGKLSLRASVTSQLFFDGVRLPESALLPESSGLRSALECLNQARYSIVWGVIGAAEACFDEALSFSNERILFGKKLAGFQLTQKKLSEMASRITQSQLLAFRLAQLKNEDRAHFSQISMGKQVNVECALAVARTARDILGASGIIDEHSVMRHMNNLESVYTYEGTNDIHHLIIGHALTGISAFE